MNGQNDQNILNGKYVYQGMIGESGTGTIFRVQTLNDQRLFLLKLVKSADQRINAQTLFNIQFSASRFSVFSHANAIPVYEPELCPEGLLIRQNDVPGQSLCSYIKKMGQPLPYDLCLRVMEAITSVMASLHSENYVFGKLDTSHILVKDSGDVALSYLELPPDFDSNADQYRDPVDTLRNEMTIQGDVFSLGVVLAEIFTSLIPFRKVSESNSSVECFRYYQDGLNIPTEEPLGSILGIIRKCLLEDRTMRFQNCVEVYWAFRYLNEDRILRETAPIPMQSTGEKIPQIFQREKNEDCFPTQTKTKKNKGKHGKKPVWLIIMGLFFIGGVCLFLINLNNEAAPELPNYRATLQHLYATQTLLAMEVSTQDESLTVSTEGAAMNSSATEVSAVTQTPEPKDETPVPFTAASGEQVRWLKDDSVMAAIPEGDFWIGMNGSFLLQENNMSPKNKVFISGFWMDKTEVTQAQYAKCVEASVCESLMLSEEITGEDFPVVNASWNNADAYCRWVGKRLPTEAEWEKAARGSDQRIYPWGNFSPYNNEGVSFISQTLIPVGTNSADISPYGILDLGGNVSEWVNDFYTEERVLAETGSKNPAGPLSGTLRTVKGGSSNSQQPEYAALAAARQGVDPTQRQSFGFRCAASDITVNTANAARIPKPALLADPLPYDSVTETCENKAGFVADTTIPDGTKLTVGEWVTKTWLLRNVGTCFMNENYKILWEDETIVNPQEMFDIGVNLAPGEEGEVSISFRVQGDGDTKIGFILSDTEGKTFRLGERGRGELWIDYVAE